MSEILTMITGASSGLGEATALRLAQEHDLLLHGRDEERLNEIAERCRASGHRVYTFRYDFAGPENLSADLAGFLTEHDLKVENFLHFAGMTEVLPISKSKYSVGLEVFNVNYFAATEIIGALTRRRINGPVLRRVVLCSSYLAQMGCRYQPHYCASKGALEALCLALACELAPQVSVNVIAPGYFNTRITKTLFVDPDASFEPKTLLPPRDRDTVAQVAEFLLSEAAAYLTGVVFPVDGGERLRRF